MNDNSARRKEHSDSENYCSFLGPSAQVKSPNSPSILCWLTVQNSIYEGSVYNAGNNWESQGLNHLSRAFMEYSPTHLYFVLFSKQLNHLNNGKKLLKKGLFKIAIPLLPWRWLSSAVIRLVHLKREYSSFLERYKSSQALIILRHPLKQFILFYLFIFCLFGISWATPTAYGGSQARGLIRAVATSLYQSHSNAGSKPCLQPTPQLTATPDR